MIAWLLLFLHKQINENVMFVNNLITGETHTFESSSSYQGGKKPCQPGKSVEKSLKIVQKTKLLMICVFLSIYPTFN